MTTRTVYDATSWSAPHFYEHPHRPALLAWLRANDIDPDRLPVEQRITLEGDTIRYVVHVVNEEGRKVLNQDGDGPVLEARATPCTVQPPAELTDTGR